MRNYDKKKATELSDASVSVYGSNGLLSKFYLPVSTNDNYDNPFPYVDQQTNVTTDPLAEAAVGNFTEASEMARVFCMHVADPVSPAQMHDCGRYFSYWAAFNAQKSIACPPTDEDCRGRQEGDHCSETVPGSYFWCNAGPGDTPKAPFKVGGFASLKHCSPSGDNAPKCFAKKLKLSVDGCSVVKTSAAEITCNAPPEVRVLCRDALVLHILTLFILFLLVDGCVGFWYCHTVSIYHHR